MPEALEVVGILDTPAPNTLPAGLERVGKLKPRADRPQAAQIAVPGELGAPQRPYSDVVGRYVTEPLVGAAEAATKLAGQTLVEFPASSIAGLAGLATMATQGGKAGVKRIEEVQKAMHPYLVREPTTESGKRISGAVEKGMEYVGKLAHGLGDVVQAGLEYVPIAAPGPAIGGAVAEAGTELAVPAALAGGVARGVRGPRPAEPIRPAAARPRCRRALRASSARQRTLRHLSKSPFRVRSRVAHRLRCRHSHAPRPGQA